MEVGREREQDLAALEAESLPLGAEELLARIAVARGALDDIVAAIAPTILAERRDAAGWRVLDHLAHLAAWERMLAAHLERGDDHLIVGKSAERYATMALQQINDALHARYGGQTADETMRVYTETHAAIIALIERLPEDAWSRAYWDDDPSGRTVMEKVSGDTYQHYLEHRGWIMAMI